MPDDAPKAKRPPSARTQGGQASRCRLQGEITTRIQGRKQSSNASADQALNSLRDSQKQSASRPQLMRTGWIKSYRKIWDNPRSRDPHWMSVWNYILHHAAFAPCKDVFDGRVIELKPGQLVTGRHEIAKFTGVDDSKVWRVLEQLKNEQQIEQQPGRKCSIITVLNWSEYQSAEQQTEQQLSNSRAATEQQLSTVQEEKKERSNSLGGQVAIGSSNEQVELPAGFPRTEDEAKKAVSMIAVPPDFAVTTYHAAVSRGGRDAKGQPIRSFASHVQAAWNYNQNAKAERTSRGVQPTDRNQFVMGAGETDYGELAKRHAAASRKA